MASFTKFNSIVAAAIVLLAVSATAQDGAQPIVPVSCVAAQTIDFLPANISGKWYEVARNPLPADINCVEVNVGVSPRDTNLLLVNVTYANSNAFPYVNETVWGNITTGGVGVTFPNANGFNISYLVGSGIYEKNVTFKLLATDYDNYALVCGYTNATDNSTEFGAVLTRDRNITNTNSTGLNWFEYMGFNMSTVFLNGTMPQVLQSDECWASGAATTLPFLSAMFAMIYMLLQHFN